MPNEQTRLISSDKTQRLCAPQATVIWTRHRHPPDLTPYIRGTFERAGFGELAFEDSPPFGVGVNRLLAPPLPFYERCPPV
jgi:hypothetical protein